MIGYSVFHYQKKKTPVAQLTLVSLVDIFTFFIFFLLLNAGDSPKIENARYVKLPDSTSNAVPSHKLVVYIDAKNLWVEDKIVASVADVLASPDKQIVNLATELNSRKEKKVDITEEEKLNGLSITIMGDKSVTYKVLKSVMATCQGSDYRNISLAVNQVVPGAKYNSGAPSTKAGG